MNNHDPFPVEKVWRPKNKFGVQILFTSKICDKSFHMPWIDSNILQSKLIGGIKVHVKVKAEPKFLKSTASKVQVRYDKT